MPWPPNMKARLALPDNPVLQCDCGHRQSADMVWDAAELPPEMRARIEEYVGRPVGLVCDACRMVPIKEGVCSHERMYRHCGAPDLLCARLKAHDALLQTLKATGPVL